MTSGQTNIRLPQEGSILLMMATPYVSQPKIDVLGDSASFYAYREGKLMLPLDPDTKPEPVAEFVHDSFRALVLNPRFSCVAAKSAFNKDNYRFSAYHHDLASPEATAQLARDLYLFVNEQKSL